MTTEEREGVTVASLEQACERCGDFAALYPVHLRSLCEACIERLPDAIHATATMRGWLRSVWLLLTSVPVALPLALAIEAVTEVCLWVIHIDHTLFVIAVGTVGSSFAQLVLVGLFHESLHGERVDVRGSWRRAARVFPRAAVTDLQSLTVTLLAFLAFVVPGLYVMMRWLVTTPVVLYEGVSGPAAMKRSGALMDGAGWAAFGSLWVVMLPPLVLGSITTAVHQYYFPGQSSGTLPALAMLPVEIFFGTWSSIVVAALMAVVYANRRFHVASPGGDSPAPYPASTARATPAP